MMIRPGLGKKINKRELTFLAIGILMLGIVILGTIYSLQFLLTQLQQGLDQGVANAGPPLRFEFYKVKELTK